MILGVNLLCNDTFSPKNNKITLFLKMPIITFIYASFIDKLSYLKKENNFKLHIS